MAEVGFGQRPCFRMREPTGQAASIFARADDGPEALGGAQRRSTRVPASAGSAVRPSGRADEPVDRRGVASAACLRMRQEHDIGLRTAVVASARKTTFVPIGTRVGRAGSRTSPNTGEVDRQAVSVRRQATPAVGHRTPRRTVEGFRACHRSPPPMGQGPINFGVSGRTDARSFGTRRPRPNPFGEEVGVARAHAGKSRSSFRQRRRGPCLGSGCDHG